MAGDIRSILLSSDAANSLRMEKRIAKVFERHKWMAERGMYYTDPGTGKQREIDVYVAKLLDRPSRTEGTGGPIINLNIFCECKSLRGTNILLSQGSLPMDARNTVMDYWVGWEDDLRKIVLGIAAQASITDHVKIKALYDYAVGRAYPHGGMALKRPVSMPPPPVDLIASAFRETKSGKINSDNTSDQSRLSPVWNAIRSSLSAVQAAKKRARDTSLEYVLGAELKFYGADEFRNSIAFFLDAELLRNGFFHPFVVLNARLWHLNDDQLEEVSSARIQINSLDMSTSMLIS